MATNNYDDEPYEIQPEEVEVEVDKTWAKAIKAKSAKVCKKKGLRKMISIPRETVMEVMIAYVEVAYGMKNAEVCVNNAEEMIFQVSLEKDKNVRKSVEEARKLEPDL